VADGPFNDRVQVFDDAGTFQFAFGTSGTGNGQFSYPLGIAVHDTGSIYVSDAGIFTQNHRVQAFDSTGAFQLTFGTSGTGDGEFQVPWGIAFDTAGDVYVTDGGNDRVQVFDNAGAYQFQFGTPGTGPGNLDSPRGIAIDDTNRIYVTEANNRVSVWQVVPEPGTLVLSTIGLLCIGGLRRSARIA
jgi:DNA-binding beta-propeller fold protein YncE